MKKIIYLIVTILMLPQLALASNIHRLKEVMDDYNFAMTVEWDQKDETFVDHKTAEFETEIEALINDGLTIEDLQAVTQLDLIAISEEVKLLGLNTIEEITSYLYQRNFKKKGASWNPESFENLKMAGAAVLILGAGAALIFLPAIAIKYLVDKNGDY